MFCSGNIFNFIKVKIKFVHRLVCSDILEPGEPRFGIASLTMYDVTMFTFGKKVMVMAGCD